MRYALIGAGAFLLGAFLVGVTLLGHQRGLEAELDVLRAQQLTSRPYTPPDPDPPAEDPVEVETPTRREPPARVRTPRGLPEPADGRVLMITGEEQGGQILDEAREALNARREAHWEALVRQARPTEAQLEQLDAELNLMNTELRDIGLDLLARTADQGPTRRDMMAFSVDALDVLLTAQEAIEDILDPAQLEHVSAEARDPVNHIDGRVLTLLGPSEL